MLVSAGFPGNAYAFPSRGFSGMNLPIGELARAGQKPANREIGVPRKTKTRIAGVSDPGRGNCLRGAWGKL